MSESVVEKQVRLILERQCRAAADLLAKELPAGVVFCLVLADVGAKGNVAYVSSCERDAAAKLLSDLVRKWRAEQPLTPPAPADCPCCHECLSPGLDTDRALVIAFVSGLCARGIGNGFAIGTMLCPRHAAMAVECSAFLAAIGATL